MAMDFFESQDVAKRNTGRLIALFGLAVLSIVLLTNLLVFAAMEFSSESTGLTVNGEPAIEFTWETFLTIGLVVTAVVLAGSLYRIFALRRGGGARVAEMLNGRLLVPGSGDARERRLLNVVEEMAIASGMPVPPVYLLEEEGINAFAAGYSAADAVIGVTRGAVDTLNREQLQGVIAHEFSHVLHGDMRINIRLIGVLYGILLIGIIGEMLMRSGRHRHVGSSSSSSRNSGAAVLLGLGLVIIGYVGTFFGNLIKAAVSRQREFLADASAVQFTRNPNGIGGALMKISRHTSNSYLSHPSADEISHALFEEGGKISALGSLLRTHPPINDRIAAIMPDWNGQYDLISSEPDDEAALAEETATAAESAAQPKSGLDKAASILAGPAGAILAERVIRQTGNAERKHLDFAQQIIEEMPVSLHDAAREPSGARAVIYLLVLSDDEEQREAQLAHLKASADEGVYDELQRLDNALIAAGVNKVVDAQRLPLVEIAQGALRQLSERQYKLFRDNFQKLIAMDNSISLLEWSLQKIVFHQLDLAFGLSKPARLGRTDMKELREEIALLLAILARSTKQQDIARSDAFTHGVDMLAQSDKKMKELKPPKPDTMSFSALSESVNRLQKLKPLQKPVVLKAMAATITADGHIAAIEAEAYRALAVLLDCPMPPLEV